MSALLAFLGVQIFIVQKSSTPCRKITSLFPITLIALFICCENQKSASMHLQIMLPYKDSVKLSLVAQSCPTLCDPMDRTMPSFPVHRQLVEFTHTHVHWVSDAIQPSHLLSSPSPPGFLASGSFQMSQFFTSSGQVGGQRWLDGH